MYGQNYLGNMDPELIQQIVDYVPESPYAAIARRDPTFGPATADFMYNLANPPMDDLAMGVPQPLANKRELDGPSAGEIAAGIMTAPFRALGLVKQGVEDALGHRNSRMRNAEDIQIEVATKLGLLSNTLTKDQKKAIFPDRAAEIDAMYAARSGQGGDTAMGRNTSGLPTPEPRQTGVWEWLTGQNRKIRDQQLAQAAMVQHAIDQNMKAAEMRTEIEHGNLYGAQTRGQNINNYYLPQQNEAEIAVKATAAEQNRAAASKERAHAGLYGAQTGGVLEGRARDEDSYWNVDRPGKLAKNERDARMFDDVTYPAGLKSLEYTANEEGRKAQGFSLWGELQRAERAREDNKAAADVYKSTAQGDAALGGIADDQARAAAIYDQMPLRGRLLQSEIDRTDAQTGYTNARTSLTEEQARAVPKRLAAELARLDSQMEGIAGQQRVRDMQARLLEIQGDAMMNRDQRDAVLSDVKTQLTMVRSEVAKAGMGNADVLTRARAKLLDKELERIESVIGLNDARAGVVGLLRGGRGGGSAMERLAFTQANKNTKAQSDLLQTALDKDAGTIYDQRNQLLSLGMEEGEDKDFVIREPWFGGTPRIEFPPNSRLRGAQARIFSTETTAEPSPAAVEPSIAPMDRGRSERLFSLLQNAMPINSGRHADTMALATKLSQITDERSFYMAAKEAGLPKDMAKRAWEGMK